MLSDATTPLDHLKRISGAFRDARDWRRFHNPKDLALALSCEAGELLELFRFQEAADVQRDQAEALSEEMADILYWLLMLSDQTGIDLSAALQRKMEINERKYPVALAHGRNVKYTVLEAEARAQREEE
jgi:NTP pyrophosphatase (non-canonical NTP hydrolase)